MNHMGTGRKKNPVKHASKSSMIEHAIAYEGFEIHSIGMVDGDVPEFMGKIEHMRETSFVHSESKFIVRTKLFVTRNGTDESSKEVREIVWATAIHTFLIERHEDGKVTHLSSNFETPQHIESKVVLNLLMVAHSSMRGVFASLVRGTWLKDLVPIPIAALNLIAPEAKPNFEKLDSARWMV
ncbi:MAG: hypothetical protein JSS89_12890 [Bacteroidetes bacterium]|nr:hypothetical protein [Bacteroidota bacterium]